MPTYGTAGGSLHDHGSWLDNDATARVGLVGERQTGHILDRLAAVPEGPAVLHDLRIPRRGVKANIDHAIVSGRTVTLLDAKVWRGGFYWTLFGSTRRGRQRFEPADKKTLPMAQQAIRDHLSKSVTRFALATPLLVIWPSNPRQHLTLTLYRPAGARALTSDEFQRTVAARFPKPAAADVLAALTPLVRR